MPSLTFFRFACALTSEYHSVTALVKIQEARTNREQPPCLHIACLQLPGLFIPCMEKPSLFGAESVWLSMMALLVMLAQKIFAVVVAVRRAHDYMDVIF